MAWTTSARERWLWAAVAVVVTVIAASLTITPDLATEIRRSALAAPFFAAGMIAVVAAALLLGMAGRRATIRGVVIASLVAVALLGVSRVITAAERTHLIEYAAVALLAHAALLERSRHVAVPRPGLGAVALAVSIGTLDELVQVVIPDRVFDPIDIAFNAGAAVGAVATVALLRRTSRRRWTASR